MSNQSVDTRELSQADYNNRPRPGGLKFDRNTLGGFLGPGLPKTKARPSVGFTSYYRRCLKENGGPISSVSILGLLPNHVDQARARACSTSFQDALSPAGAARGYPATETSKDATIKSPTVHADLPMKDSPPKSCIERAKLSSINAAQDKAMKQRVAAENSRISAQCRRPQRRPAAANTVAVVLTYIRAHQK